MLCYAMLCYDGLCCAVLDCHHRLQVERRLVAKAKLITIDGSTDAFMLCSGTTANRWSKAKPLVDEAINSFKADPAADFSEAMV